VNAKEFIKHLLSFENYSSLEKIPKSIGGEGTTQNTNLVD
jgi:hypothetical protein